MVRRKEIKLAIDFIQCLSETGEFQNLLLSEFDFKQFKVFSNNQKEIILYTKEQIGPGAHCHDGTFIWSSHHCNCSC